MGLPSLASLRLLSKSCQWSFFVAVSHLRLSSKVFSTKLLPFRRYSGRKKIEDWFLISLLSSASYSRGTGKSARCMGTQYTRTMVTMPIALLIIQLRLLAPGSQVLQWVVV